MRCRPRSEPKAPTLSHHTDHISVGLSVGNGRKGDNSDPKFFSLRDQKTGCTLN